VIPDPKAKKIAARRRTRIFFIADLIYSNIPKMKQDFKDNKKMEVIIGKI